MTDGRLDVNFGVNMELSSMVVFKKSVRSCFKRGSFQEKLSERGGLLEVSRTSERNFDVENDLLKQFLMAA